MPGWKLIKLNQRVNNNTSH